MMPAPFPGHFENAPTPSITAISVDSLFGRYNYSLALNNPSSSSLSLLYGDNGTGKTTVLNLIFHLLSSDTARGHKSRIARIPFKHFSVTFSNDAVVSASKEGDNLTGSFRLGLRIPGKRNVSVRLNVESDTGRIPVSHQSPEFRPLLNQISAIVPRIFYLRDNRTLESDEVPSPESRTVRHSVIHDIAEPNWVDAEPDGNDRRRYELYDSIRRTQEYLYVELARVSTRGEADARQIYADILRSIASPNALEEATPNTEQDLREELRDLERISATFSEFGLGPAIQAAPLAESLSNASSNTRPVVIQVLMSFLNGQRARMNALDILYQKMLRLSSIANAYFTDKDVRLRIPKGLTIHVPNGELLPESLSSGETHLLLLLLNVFTSTEQSRLFLIDEPELSLNVKWQRELVSSLLDLTEHSHCQFLLATHSIELLAKHRDFVVPLAP